MEPSAPTILIVDDQQTLRQGIFITLSAAGYQPIAAADGAQALEILQRQSVALIIADIAMPRMNGYQLYERVCADPRLLRIPFIFLTARGLDSDVRYGKELGADDYLVKPVEPEDLLAVVAGRLRRAALLEQANLQQQAEEAHLAVSDNLLVFGGLRLNLRQHRVWMYEEEIELSAREFAVLEHLLRQPGEVVTLRELAKVSHSLNTDDVETGMLLRPLMRILRRKLGYRAGELGCIENVRSVGYRLIKA